MDKKKLPFHLCLTFHCLEDNSSEKSLVYPEFFVKLEELEELILLLKHVGYKFVLPQDSQLYEKTCSITFDDGYANNQLFLSLANKYEIPFILFVNSYPIEEQSPFLWDAMSYHKEQWNLASDSYKECYEKLSSENNADLLRSVHRPMTEKELISFMENDYAYIAYHSHYHRPLTKSYGEKYLLEEIYLNKKFLSRFKCKLLNHFALPSGLITRKNLRELKERFDHIYTINGAKLDTAKCVVDRVSLISPKFAGRDLYSQIFNSCTLKYKVLRFMINIKNSYLEL